MSLDLRIFLKELERTHAKSWNELLADVETLAYKYIEHMPEGYEAADIMSAVETLGWLSYDTDELRFKVRLKS